MPKTGAWSGARLLAVAMSSPSRQMSRITHDSANLVIAANLVRRCIQASSNTRLMDTSITHWGPLSSSHALAVHRVPDDISPNSLPNFGRQIPLSEPSARVHFGVKPNLNTQSKTTYKALFLFLLRRGRKNIHTVAYPRLALIYTSKARYQRDRVA